MAYLARKLEKTRRYLQWRFAGGDRLPLWWHIGQPNFGDDINPMLMEQLTGVTFRFAADRTAPHMLGMGSILDRANSSSIVCGSGFLSEPHEVPPIGEVVAVRGHLSRAALRLDEEIILGDPALLISEVLQIPEPKRHRFGYVPHVRSVENWKSRVPRDAKLIDPGAKPFDVVRDIALCEVVFSQSLHGLIVADALNVPNVWVAPCEEMVGGRFKFDDYFSTLDHPKKMIPETPEIFARPGYFDPSLGHYRYCKTAYRKALVAAASRLQGRQPASGNTST